MLRWLTAATALCALYTAAQSEDGPLGAFPPDAITLPAEESTPLEPLSVRVYPVADLVVAPPRMPTAPAAVGIETSPLPSAVAAKPVSAGATDQENLAELSVILQSVVDPASWEMSGGHGHVAVHGNSLSLIVRQTDAVHLQVAELLEQLRGCQQVEVQLAVDFIVPKATAADSDAAERRLDELLAELNYPLSIEQASALRSQLTQDAEVVPIRRLRLNNGGSARLSGEFSCRAVVAPDRRSVLLHLLTDGSGAQGAPHAEQHRIPDGRSLLIPVGDPEVNLMLALISAQIAVPEEDETLLPVPEQEEKHPTPLRTNEQVAEEDPFAKPVSTKSRKQPTTNCG